MNGGRHPPVKKLRLRGDWSDTGPHARPEGEREPTAAGWYLLHFQKLILIMNLFVYNNTWTETSLHWKED